MVRLVEPGDPETELETAFGGDGQGPGEAAVGDRPAEEAGGEGQVDALLTVRLGVRAVGVERERGRRGVFPEQGADEAADVIGTGRVGAGRPAHDRAEDVVEDAYEFHCSPSADDQAGHGQVQGGVAHGFEQR